MLEMSRMWNTKVRKIPIHIGAFGAVFTHRIFCPDWRNDPKGDSMQQTADRGSAHSLNKVLSFQPRGTRQMAEVYRCNQ